jgi:hypothetical protein
MTIAFVEEVGTPVAEDASASTIALVIGANGVPLHGQLIIHVASRIFPTTGTSQDITGFGPGVDNAFSWWFAKCTDTKGNLYVLRGCNASPVNDSTTGVAIGQFHSHIRTPLVSGDVVTVHLRYAQIKRVIGGAYYTVDSGNTLVPLATTLSGGAVSATVGSVSASIETAIPKLMQETIGINGVIADTWTIDTLPAMIETITRTATAGGADNTNTMIVAPHFMYSTEGTTTSSHTITSRNRSALDVIYVEGVDDPPAATTTDGARLVGGSQLIQ